MWLNDAVGSERPVWTSLWNISKRRFCTDGGANRIVGRPKLQPPDLVVGDMDSILPAVAESLKLKAVLINVPDQDKTDLTKCLEVVAEHFKNGLEGSRVVLLGGTSGRFDHALAAINSMYYSITIMNQEVYCLEGENLTFVIDEGEHYIEIDEQLVTGICGVIPFCQKVTTVTMNGFRWNLEDANMAFGSLISTSNFMEKNVLQVKTSAPLIFTMELRPCAVL